MIKVLVATDCTLYRQSIEAVLRAGEHTAVVDATPDFVAAAASADIALLDVTIKDSLSTLASIRQCAQPPKVVAISAHDEPHTVLAWIESGCRGFVPRTATAAALLRAVHDTHHGELVLEPRLLLTVVNRLTSLKSVAQLAPSVALTAREKQILNLVSQGLPNKAIASRLGISYATAKNHVHHILDKLHLHRRREVTMHVRGLQ